MELWDAYDRDFKKVQGVTLIRGEKVPENYFHLVCDIIVRHADGSYLVMQRDKRKHLGGMWEATAGGSALQGEDSCESLFPPIPRKVCLSSSETDQWLACRYSRYQGSAL